MELHQLRRFAILAEELHFTRAAERLHIEQPPLSRTIRELEDELGTALFYRNHHHTRLTAAGNALLHKTRRVLTVLDQAREEVKAVASGLQGSLHIAVSDHVIDVRLAAFLAHCRAEEPETAVAVDEVPNDALMTGLQEGRYDAGLAFSSATDAALRSQPLWREPMAVAMPLRYPLLSKTTLTLDDVLRYPIFRWQAETCPLLDQQMIAHLPKKSCDIQCVTSFEMMALRVAAGYGIGITAQSRITHARAWDICMRALLSDSDASFEIVTYWLYPDGKADPACTRFAHRARQLAKTGMA